MCVAITVVVIFIWIWIQEKNFNKNNVSDVKQSCEVSQSLMWNRFLKPQQPSNRNYLLFAFHFYTNQLALLRCSAYTFVNKEWKCVPLPGIYIASRQQNLYFRPYLTTHYTLLLKADLTILHIFLKCLVPFFLSSGAKHHDKLDSIHCSVMSLCSHLACLLAVLSNCDQTLLPRMSVCAFVWGTVANKK